MTVYQELQLNQAGSKALIRSCTNRKDKMRHTAIYLFKICLTMAFCMQWLLDSVRFLEMATALWVL